MLVLTCCVRSESSPRRCERDALLLPLLLCRSLAQAWMHRAVRADAGVLRQCGHFWRWRMSAGQSARCPELLLCIADVCLSLAHVSRAVAPRYHSLYLSLASACVPGWRCWRRPRCVLATCSEGKPCTCEDMYSPGAPAPARELAAVKREPVICRRPTLFLLT